MHSVALEIERISKRRAQTRLVCFPDMDKGSTHNTQPSESLGRSPFALLLSPSLATAATSTYLLFLLLGDYLIYRMSLPSSIPGIVVMNDCEFCSPLDHVRPEEHRHHQSPRNFCQHRTRL